MSQPVLLKLLVNSTNLLQLSGINPTLIVPSIPVVGPMGPAGPIGPAGRLFITQEFIATEGQTEFVWASASVEFDANDYYLAFVDGSLQSHYIITRTGNIFTATVPLSEGQVLIIAD